MRPEDREQEMLMRWARETEIVHPELALLHHIPNGGKRNPAEAAHLKRLGVKAGVPDLCLPVARGGFHGLYIELKAGKNRPTEMQKTWIDALSAQGFAAFVCYGAAYARKVIEAYLKGEKT
mgnify:FL=1|jgi:hypothetical protein|nr:MAG TPA: Nuclease [Caudoviricetes sp.]